MLPCSTVSEFWGFLRAYTVLSGAGSENWTQVLWCGTWASNWHPNHHARGSSLSQQLWCEHCRDEGDFSLSPVDSLKWTANSLNRKMTNIFLNMQKRKQHSHRGKWQKCGYPPAQHDSETYYKYFYRVGRKWSNPGEQYVIFRKTVWA